MSRLTSTLNRYVDVLSKFEGADLAGVAIGQQGKPIITKELQVAIPSGSMTAAQRGAFEAAAQRAQSKGVELIVTEIK